MRYGQHHFPFEMLLNEVALEGELRTDRTGTGTRSIFSPNPLRFDLSGGHVPLITSKAVPWKMATREFMWMLSGSTSTRDLAEASPAMARIWDNWADANGDLGPTYGAQYRNAGGSLSTGDLSPFPSGEWAASQQAGLKHDYGVDQLARIVKMLAKTPDTRRAVISLWSVPELDDMALEPCMVLFQFSLRGPNLNELHVQVYQRSADMMLGVPFDLYQAGLLAHLVARELTLITGRVITAEGMTWSAGDAHIYLNQLGPVEVQLNQWANAEVMQARISIDPFPSLRLLDGSLEAGHINVLNYNPEPAVGGGQIAI